ncbi:MAG: hypothetical protein V2J24_20160 [Pseudomonadales bacterium]|jgi:hypothetical protein|nr:hypothetical protein [Pseudomonadales bacterium]
MDTSKLINALVPILTVLRYAGVNLKKLDDILDRADAEGRDPTPEEIAEAREAARESIDRL